MKGPLEYHRDGGIADEGVRGIGRDTAGNFEACPYQNPMRDA